MSKSIPKTINRMSLLVLFLITCINRSHSAIVSMYNYTSSSKYDMQIDSLTVICNNKYDECETGENATFAGILTLTGDLTSDEVYVSAYYEKFYMNVQTIYDKKPIYLCDHMISMTGDEEICPGPDTYNFLFEHTLPEIYSVLAGWTITIVATFYDANNNIIGHFEAKLPTKKGNTESISYTSASEQAESMNYSLSSEETVSTTNQSLVASKYTAVVGCATVLGVGLIFGLFRRRQKRKMEEAEEINRFHMLPDMIEASRLSKGESAFV